MKEKTKILAVEKVSEAEIDKQMPSHRKLKMMIEMMKIINQTTLI